ncbi:Oligoribonuclease [Buchnera aphidicola (Eriosoma grossulariae)]|uniref:oligoribonuclease n=1 Tax=Buchnera aphidicola TaxID=9 RepID=UPI0034646D4E
MNINKQNLIWIDLEMTGLNPEKDRIIEIATLITDNQLKILDIGPVIPIFQPLSQLNNMDKKFYNIHKKNGLIELVKNSQFHEQKAELKTIKFLKKWVPKNTSPICGNTVAQDRKFLYHYMPKLESYFHYRYIDVSTIKELAYRWKPKIFKYFHKKNNHSALNDIYESISELKFYKKNFIKI